MFEHKPVLLEEAIAGLNIDKDKIYVDATMGGGGHSEKILEVLKNGKGILIGIDQDIDAINSTKEKLKSYIDDKKLIVVKENFEKIDKILDDLQIKSIDGILMDLGVSSFQFDEGDRGFSYNKEARLDMRMNKEETLTAYEVVNAYSEKELYEIIKEFGEEPFAKNIAKHIVDYRKIGPIETTIDLANIIKGAIPAKLRYSGAKGKNPAKKTFQALRIYINRELEVLDVALDKILERLDDRGRIVVITFHSLEDKLVKSKFKIYEDPCTCPKGYPCVCGKKSKGIVVNKKAIIASEEEIERNRRAHSAKLRIFDRRI